MKTSSIILAVPDRDPFVRTIEFHFTRSGWKVMTATSVKEAQQILTGNEAYLTILDSGLFFLPSVGTHLSGPSSILAWAFLVLVFFYVAG